VRPRTTYASTASKKRDVDDCCSREEPKKLTIADLVTSR
jgi:hypothetical protein